jgi:tetratricopeptide (TPR) repeat protein
VNLRLDGKPFFLSENGLVEERIEDLIMTAARASLRETQPYSFGVLAYMEGNQDLALIAADSIIAHPVKCTGFYIQLTYQYYCRDIVSAHILKGAVLADLARQEEAMAELKVAVALDPKSARTHAVFGVVLRGLRQWEEAVAEFKAAIALDPKAAAQHAGLGVVLADLGRQEEAIA